MKLPLKIAAHAESFGITDAAGTIIAYVYFGVGDETQRQAAKRMTRDEAESVAKTIARALTDNAGTNPTTPG